MKNTMIIQGIVEDLEISLIHCKNDAAKRDIGIQIVRLNSVFVDLENYNDIKMALKKIVD